MIKIRIKYLLILIVVAGSFFYFTAYSSARPGQAAALQELLPQERKTVSLFESCAPSVVYITSIAVRQDLFSMNVFKVPQGTGSGFIWDKKGHVVTNFHVIQDAQAAEVTLADHSNWKASLVGVEVDKDLAVLKIDAPADKLQPVKVGSSASLRVGQSVYAIGNPFGFDHTLTTGIISGLGREITSVSNRPIQGVIQTDAAINPGNSGGPLLDSHGRLIGINTAIYSPSGAYAGIGFAVPVDTIKRLVPQIIRYGKARKPGLGIQIADDYITARLDIKGVLIVDVLKGSPAAKAGLKPTVQNVFGEIVLGDIIVALNGKPINNTNDLYRILDNLKVGDTVRLTVERDGRRRTVTITLMAV
ncbi:MAG: PDZ domain-containing protein [Candidatus Dadabacteria bacterium]|nr:MAG: PDZ domain-containing protein [Candidatus Dadabacteria bacterium]